MTHRYINTPEGPALLTAGLEGTQVFIPRGIRARMGRIENDLALAEDGFVYSDRAAVSPAAQALLRAKALAGQSDVVLQACQVPRPAGSPALPPLGLPDQEHLQDAYTFARGCLEQLGKALRLNGLRP